MSDCEGKQLILSEIQRPQLAKEYPAAWYVGPNNWEEIGRRVEGGEVECMSRQALDYPYRQYEGQLPYPLSGREGKRGFLTATIKAEGLQVAAEKPQHPELTLYSYTVE